MRVCCSVFALSCACSLVRAVLASLLCRIYFRHFYNCFIISTTMLPTRKKARVTRPVTPPSTRPATPPTACPQSSVMCSLSDSSSDSPPCSVRPVIKYDLAADAQQALTTTSSPTHVASVHSSVGHAVVVGDSSADI